MLPKENRLNKDKEFNNVFKNGKSIYSKALGIKTLENGLNISRFGILVGLKVSKKAVERNKIKRQIRDVLKTNIEFIKKGYDIVIISLPEIKNINFSEIKSEIEESLKRIRFIK